MQAAVRVNVGIEQAGGLLRLPIELEIDGEHRLLELKAEYAFDLSLDDRQLAVIEAGVAVFVGQLLLCDSVCTSRPVPPGAPRALSALGALLYGIRNLEEGTRRQPPVVATRQSGRRPMPRGPSRRMVINLISGGKDSAVAHLLLARNGFEVTDCFVDGLNICTNSYELSACTAIYQDFQRIKLSGFTPLIELACSVSSSLGRPPVHNFVPRGRDLLAVLLAMPLALHTSAFGVAAASERDLWKRVALTGGAIIPVHDSQSEHVVRALRDLIASSAPGLCVFSPIAGIYELRLFKWLVDSRPDIIRAMSSCFYGRWCGQCFKCIRYSLLQEYLQVRLIRFADDPFRHLGGFLSRWSRRRPEESRPYNEEMLFLLAHTPRAAEAVASLGCPHLLRSVPSLSSMLRAYPASLLPRRYKSLL